MKRWTPLAVLSLVCVGAAVPAHADDIATIVHKVVEIAANPRVVRGVAVGVSVGVIAGGHQPLYYNYGSADLSAGQVFTKDTLFAIGSVTKIFTTNLLGQAVNNGTYSLSTPLSAFSVEIGTLPPLMSQATLGELGDFTAGLPEDPDSCAIAPTRAGCISSGRPDITAYTAADFAAWLRGEEPFDFYTNTPATSLPTPALYSDISIGYLGLLLGATPGQPWSNQALTEWANLLQGELLDPLGMKHTGLYSPSNLPSGSVLSQGYSRAQATPQVSNGSLTGITVTTAGIYTTPPAVQIQGGGGTGATAEAVLSNGGVSSITVSNPGSGYVAEPVVAVQANGDNGTGADVTPVIAGGKVIGFNVHTQGTGYTNPPTIIVSGGRAATGSDATATAHIANGGLIYVSVNDGGSGYYAPLSVLIGPAPLPFNNIPIWAPGGALSSTMQDMMQLASAALGDVGGPAITDGFKVAETPYACVQTASPDLSTCPADSIRFGLAWSVIKPTADMPLVIAKNGGLPGYSTDVLLMPDRQLAVVVFVNTNDNNDDGVSVHDSEQIANEILNGLFVSLPAQ